MSARSRTRPVALKRVAPFFFRYGVFLCYGYAVGRSDTSPAPCRGSAGHNPHSKFTMGVLFCYLMVMTTAPFGLPLTVEMPTVDPEIWIDEEDE